jgi:deoxyribonuclease-4
MPILGAHMSIAGGYYKSVLEAKACACDCVQLFTKNNNQWRAKPITDEEVSRFQAELVGNKIAHPISHASYLINLASPDKELWQKSIDAFIVELQRADQLGIPYVVVHPGSYTTSSEALGIQAIARALDEVHRQTPKLLTKTLLETTAGQGSNLGWRFEQLAAMLDKVKAPERVGVCLDTCHIFAAGYPIGTPQEYQATFAEFDRVIGLGQLKAFHLNDSQRELGSRVDRHEHIGRGKMGREPFRHLMQDARFAEVPMYLETPKGEEKGVALDVVNIRLLRRLAK